MKTIVTRFLADESGATAIEYGLIAAIVGVGIIAGLGTLRDALNTMFGNVGTTLTTQSGGAGGGGGGGEGGGG